ncbi:hypothetical protein GCM10027614_79680 [Micromonospora vulcania]
MRRRTEGTHAFSDETKNSIHATALRHAHHMPNSEQKTRSETICDTDDPDRVTVRPVGSTGPGRLPLTVVVLLTHPSFGLERSGPSRRYGAATVGWHRYARRS